MVLVQSICVDSADTQYMITQNKSDISSLKTSRTFDAPIHSRALLAAILCWLTTLYVPRVAARFWCFRSRSASRHHIYVASASRYPSQTRNCARLLTVVPKSNRIAEVNWSAKARSHGNNVCDVIFAHVITAHGRLVKISQNLNVYTFHLGVFLWSTRLLVVRRASWMYWTKRLPNDQTFASSSFRQASPDYKTFKI